MAAPAVVDITAVIDREPFSRFQKIVVATCFLLIMLDTIDLTVISFAAPAIAADWGVRVSGFGPIFGAGLLGSMLGSLFLGLAADSVGRRFTIITSVAVFGAFTLLTTTAHSLHVLLIYRFLTGIGLGGVLPNIVATTSEYAPARIRAMVISAMACGLPLGSMLAGFIAAPLLPAFGWKSIFYFGGLAPVLLVPLLIWRLPESIRFLAIRKNDPWQLARILRQIAPSRAFAETDQFVIREEKIPGLPVKGLFTNNRLPKTLLLWVAFFMSYLTLFLLTSWLPSLLHQAGIPIERAIIATSLYFLGGPIGGVVLAWLSYRVESRRVIGFAFIGGALCTAALGNSQGHAISVMIALFLTGFFVIGTQVNMYAIVSAAYPTVIRSTGVGWASGVGRIGSIVGPVVAGVFLSRGTTVSALFFMTAVPGLVGSAAAFLLGRERGVAS